MKSLDKVFGLDDEAPKAAGQWRFVPGRRFGEETGGGYFELTKTDDLGRTFSPVAEELRSQYLLGVAPANLDGKLHQLDVRVSRPGTTVRARRTYLASPERSTGGPR
jgi:hypothetical protein